MAAASYQDPTEELNVQGDPTAREFEDFEESKIGKEGEEQPLNDSLDTCQPEDYLGPRKRNLTEKGLEGRLNWLRKQCINALRAVSRKRTEVSQLMVAINNLHLVKKELINLNDLIEHYKEAFYAYCGDLTNDEDRHREHAHHDEKIKDIMAYLYPVHAWVSQVEGQLANQLERASSKGSERTSKASSRLSARDKERVHLAELKAERSLLKQRQALRAAEEDLDLELKIGQAEAREKALNEMDKEHEVLPSPCGSGPPSITVSFTPIVLPSVAASSPNGLASPPRTLVSTAQTPGAKDTQVKSSLHGTRDTMAIVTVAKSSLLNSKAAEFIPSALVGKTASTPPLL